MDIYRDVGGFPVWFGLRSCFFCVTCCFWLHQAWPSRRTVVVFRWASKGYDENCHLQVWRCWISAVERWNDSYTSGLSYPKWRLEGVEGGAGDGCGVQMSEVMDASFLQRVSELSLGDGVRSSAIQEELRIRLLLLHIESSHLRWFRYLRMMPLWCLLGEMFQACRPGRRIHWRDFVFWLGWEHLGVPVEGHGWIDVYLVRWRQWYVTLDSLQTIWDLGSLHH